MRTFLGKEKPRESFQEWLVTWLKWEQIDNGFNLSIIGTDIGKGIVPTDEGARRYRDLVGWCFQDVARQANRVDVIWYGLNEQLK
ncbi:bifunctional adenosylcobinamide kinase/adenosylcobinamide-phosphate guanylyltransferase [Halalkalibacter alkalisediminis]|uniref:bifunctional adenosylcobinamide kinase/adenosylcobinamide-phosphate guanylyltransferase n=1 Tax=Halalkalibacter alkalisediminis TaxID=935616 RepID=UPI00363CCA33